MPLPLLTVRAVSATDMVARSPTAAALRRPGTPRRRGVDGSLPADPGPLRSAVAVDATARPVSPWRTRRGRPCTGCRCIGYALGTGAGSPLRRSRRRQVPASSAAVPRPSRRRPAALSESARRPATARGRRGRPASSRRVCLTDLLDRVLDLGASDLHLTSGARPTVRVQRPAAAARRSSRCMTPQDIQRMLYAVLTQKQREQLRGRARARPRYSCPAGPVPCQRLPPARLGRCGLPR